MNVITITEFLSGHPDSVSEILEDIGFSNIKFDTVKNNSVSQGERAIILHLSL